VTPLAITAFTATTAVGRGIDALRTALHAGRSGLVPNDDSETVSGAALPTVIGRVDGIEASSLPVRWQTLDCRNNRLAWLAIRQDRFLDVVRATMAEVGAARVALLVGTSTSTIEASERAYRDFARTGVAPAALARHDLHHLHATTAFLRDLLGVDGPTTTTSTACSSSAKVFAQAMRMIEVGVVDAAIVCGIDSLASSTLYGFNALGLVSSRACRPFDVARDGINIGEAAGFALVERFDPRRHVDAPLLVGYGESSDAHHMSSPHPDGLGARHAIESALRMSGVAAHAIDYINLHGTATPKNDAVEATLVASMFDAHTRASSTKGWTGHTLGAAGIVEAIVCLLAMGDGYAPGTLGCERRDAACGPQVRVEGTSGDIDIALSNAFAFGGNNCVLAFARDQAALRQARGEASS
jgi:3-oxoacyl-[acyl-carrier-protein] synthase-1